MRTTTQAPTWIWYPGDFELWLHIQISKRRDDRGVPFPPFWHLDSWHVNVQFRRRVRLEQESFIQLRVEGLFRLQVNGQTIDPRSATEASCTLPPGEHELIVSVLNDTSCPAIWMQGDQLSTDTCWEVSHYDGVWRQAAGWSLDDPLSPPSRYRLPVTTKLPVSIERSGQALLLDFGQETFGYLQLRGVQGAGEIRIYYGESREEATDLAFSCTTDRLLKSDAARADVPVAHSRAFRYATIEAEDGIHISGIDVEEELPPVVCRSSFRSSDPLLNQIWDTSLYTLQITSREFFFDGLKRDRWVWSGDAYQSVLMNFYAFFDTAINRRTMIALRGKDPVVRHINTIMDYSFYWFLMIEEDYLYTGDLSFIRSYYDRMASLMDYCLNRRNTDGFMEGLPGDWVFIDWADFDNTGETSMEQLLLARSLEVMSRAAASLGRDAEARKYEAIAVELKKRLMEVFWSPEDGALVHRRLGGQLQPEITRHANMFALLLGYLEGDQAAQVARNVLLSPNAPAIRTPYMRFYELAALCELDQHSQVLEEIRRYWGGMLALGATTFWEEYNPEEQDERRYAMYGAKYGKSLCHAWGASPVYLLGKYFMGVRPTAPGFAQYTIAPRLAGLEWLEGTVPTAHGDVKLQMSRSTLHVEVPDGGVPTLRIEGSAMPEAVNVAFRACADGCYEAVLTPGQVYTVWLREPQ